MSKDKKLSIIIPVLNEEENIAILTQKINFYLKKIKYEIIFVDDNSSDHSKKILKNLRKKLKFFNPILRNKKRDLTQSCFDGIKKSNFNTILIMDGDMQHDPKYILKMYKMYIKNNFDFVIGARPLFKRHNQGLSEFRRYASILLINLFSIFDIKTKDPMSGFFIFNKKIYTKNKKRFFGKGFKILADLLIHSQDKLKIKDIEINFKRRFGDKSKMSLKIILLLAQFYLYSLIKV